MVRHFGAAIIFAMLFCIDACKPASKFGSTVQPKTSVKPQKPVTQKNSLIPIFPKNPIAPTPVSTPVAQAPIVPSPPTPISNILPSFIPAPTNSHSAPVLLPTPPAPPSPASKHTVKVQTLTSSSDSTGQIHCDLMSDLESCKGNYEHSKEITLYGQPNIFWICEPSIHFFDNVERINSCTGQIGEACTFKVMEDMMCVTSSNQ